MLTVILGVLLPLLKVILATVELISKICELIA